MTEPFIESSEITISPDDAVAAASGFVRDSCHWHIWPQISDTRKVRPAGGELLVLPTLMLVSVESITVNGTSLDPDAVTAWEYGVLERMDGRCWPTHGVVTVDFTHGYQGVPASIRAVCQSIAKRWPTSATPWTTRQMGSARVSATGTGALVPGTLTVVEQMVIDRYTIEPQP